MANWLSAEKMFHVSVVAPMIQKAKMLISSVATEQVTRDHDYWASLKTYAFMCGDITFWGQLSLPIITICHYIGIAPSLLTR